MPANIVRFGGNNIHDPASIRSFIQVLAGDQSKQMIFISASENIQQLLGSALELLKSSLKNHQTIVAELEKEALDIAGRHKLLNTQTFDGLLPSLKRLLEGIYLTGDYSLALRDQVLSYSEDLTAALLLDILKHNQLNASLVFPDELGLTVTEEYGNASILKETTTQNILQKEWDGINLVPGSYGTTRAGKIARVGDRAADYTAASVASIFNAGRLELWGISKSFKTADDELVTDATYIKSLTYSEASEMAYFHHSSIHPRIVEPLAGRHIPIHVFELEDGRKVLTTTINSKNVEARQTIKSVAHADDIAILKLNGPGVGFKPGILATVTTAFATHQINIRSVITAQTSINIIIDKHAVSEAEKIIHGLELPSVIETEVAANISLIAIVGHGMQQNHGISAMLFSAVAKHQINVLLSGSGASDLVSYLIVDEKDKTKAVQEIHKIFFNH